MVGPRLQLTVPDSEFSDILPPPNCHSDIQKMALVARDWPDGRQLQLRVTGRGSRLGFLSGRRSQAVRAARSWTEVWVDQP